MTPRIVIAKRGSGSTGADRNAAKLERGLVDAFDAIAGLVSQSAVVGLLESGSEGDLASLVSRIGRDGAGRFRDILGSAAEESFAIGTRAATGAGSVIGWTGERAMLGGSVAGELIRTNVERGAEKLAAEAGTVLRLAIESEWGRRLVGGTKRALEDGGRFVIGLLGLTLPLATAAIRHRAALADAGLSGAAVEMVSRRYARELRRYRARAFSLTESYRSFNAGQQAEWERLYVEGQLPPGTMRRWVAKLDIHTCRRCAALHGKVTGIVEAFRALVPVGGVVTTITEMVPPLHPSCLCRLEIVLPALRAAS